MRVATVQVLVIITNLCKLIRPGAGSGCPASNTCAMTV